MNYIIVEIKVHLKASASFGPKIYHGQNRKKLVWFENITILFIENMIYLQFSLFLTIPNYIDIGVFLIQGCCCKNYLQPLNKEDIKCLFRKCYFAEEKLRLGSKKQFYKRLGGNLCQNWELKFFLNSVHGLH